MENFTGDNSVYQGQDDTGAAYKLPMDQASPFSIMADNLKQIKLDNDAKRKQLIDAATKSLTEEPYKEKPWDIDIANVMAPMLEQYRGWLTEQYKKGLNPNDPLSPAYLQNAQIKDRLNQMSTASAEHQKYYDKVYENYITHSDQYDPSSLATLQAWRNMLLNDRMKADLPVLTPYYNINEVEDKYFSGKKPTKTASAGPSGDFMYENSQESYTPEQLKGYKDELMADPKYNHHVTSLYNNLPEDQKKAYPTLDDFVMSRMNAHNFSQNTANVSHVPDGAGGSNKQNDEEEADWLLSIAAGLKNGNPSIYPNTKAKYTTGLSFFRQKPDAIDYITGNTLSSMKLGTYDEMENGKLVEKPNIIKGWKLKDGKVYVQDTRAERETVSAGSGDGKVTSGGNNKKYPDGWRPVENMFTEFIIPYIESNYGDAKAEKLKNIILKRAREKGVNLAGGSFDDLDKIYQNGTQSTTNNKYSSEVFRP